jgi:hypothetical protein
MANSSERHSCWTRFGPIVCNHPNRDEDAFCANCYGKKSDLDLRIKFKQLEVDEKAARGIISENRAFSNENK